MLKMILYYIGWGGKLRYGIYFYRDILDGTTYIISCIICIVLICLIIKILLKRYREQEKEEQEKMSSTVVLVDPAGGDERVEVSLTTTNEVATNIPVGNVSSITSVLASTDIYKDIVGEVEAEDTNDVIVRKERSVKKPIASGPAVMINPMEVAAVSGTLNLLSKSEQAASVQTVNSEAMKGPQGPVQMISADLVSDVAKDVVLENDVPEDIMPASALSDIMSMDTTPIDPPPVAETSNSNSD
jgi:hypothetical protein